MGFEAPRHVREVSLAVGSAHRLLVFGRAFQQFVIHQGVGELAVPVAQERLGAAMPDDDMRRLHVNHPVTLEQQFVGGQAGGGGEKLGARPLREEKAPGHFNDVVTFDPAVEHHVLPENVNLHLGMPGQLGAEFGFRTPGFPELEALARHINRQRLLGVNANARRAGFAFAQFHEQGKLLEGTVEFGVDEAVDGQRIQRHRLAHARPFDHQVQHPAMNAPGGDFVNGAGPFQPLPVGLKPLARVPVFRQEIPPERQAKLSQINIPAVLRLHPQILHAQEGENVAARPRFRRHRRRGAIRERIRCERVGLRFHGLGS